MILAETSVCPECGESLDESGTEATDVSGRREEDLFECCPNCGDEVRKGLLRCWSCNAFMRTDVAKRHAELTGNPQLITFSEIPEDQRSEFIPPRVGQTGGYVRRTGPVLDADAEFELDGSVMEGSSAGAAPPAESAKAGESAKPPKAAESHDPANPDQPDKETPDKAAAAAGSGKPSDSEGSEGTEADQKEQAAAGAQEKPAPAAADPGEADLLAIAMQEQREAKVRRRERRLEAQMNRVLIPCSCGAWVRAQAEQAGKTVRCRQCRKPLVVPKIAKRRRKASEKEKETGPKLQVEWLTDVHRHLVEPTKVTLKPGSLSKTFDLVDIGVSSEGIFIVSLEDSGKKKSLFARGSTEDTAAVRLKVREHIASTGAVTGAPGATCLTVSGEQLKLIRLVQPISKVHESMFAGVPVFGEGRVVLFLPLDIPDQPDVQTFLSLPLSQHRDLARWMQSQFEISVPAKENGVPEQEENDVLFCFYTQNRIEAVRNRVWYETDPAFELELSGHKCEACGAAVTEEARARNKLGGAAGKSIAKAKCPKCNNKFGSNPLYRITKAPPKPEEVEEA